MARSVKSQYKKKGMVMHVQSKSNCRIGCFTNDKMFTRQPSHSFLITEHELIFSSPEKFSWRGWTNIIFQVITFGSKTLPKCSKKTSKFLLMNIPSSQRSHTFLMQHQTINQARFHPTTLDQSKSNLIH
jgi:hypothetical protein